MKNWEPGFLGIDWASVGDFVALAVATQVVIAAIVVTCVALVLRVARRLSAAVRHDVLLASLMLILALPLGVLVPKTASIQSVETITGTAPPLATNDLGQLERAPRGMETLPSLDDAASSGWRSLDSTLASGLALFVVSLIVTALVRTLNAWRSLRELRRSARRDHSLETEVRQLCQSIGLVRSPEVFRHSELSAPAAVGVFRPWIVVPASWPDALDGESARQAVLHELGHLARRDGLALLIQRSTLALLAFCPPAWLLSRLIDTERECACDDWALAHGGGDVVSYGQTLLGFAATDQRASGPLVAGFASRRSQLKRRILNMTDNSRQHDLTRTRTWIPMALMAAVVVVGLTSPIWPRWPSSGAVSESGGGGQFGEGEPDDALVLSADDSPLYREIANGDLEDLRHLLDGGAAVDQRWPGDGSPLIEAARRGQLEIARLLLEYGATADIRVAGDGTPLIQAAAKGDFDMANLLLSYGADVDFVADSGDGNPLIEASKVGQLEMVDFLISQGAQIDIRKPGDDTPLINAAQQGNFEVVDLLLRTGADPNLEGDFDRRLEVVRTPLNQARANGHDDVADLLVAAGASD